MWRSGLKQHREFGGSLFPVSRINSRVLSIRFEEAFSREKTHADVKRLIAARSLTS